MFNQVNFASVCNLMCAKHSSSGFDDHAPRNPLENLFGDESDRPTETSDEALEQAYQTTLRQMLALTGHPDFASELQSANPSKQECLARLQAVINELHVPATPTLSSPEVECVTRPTRSTPQGRGLSLLRVLSLSAAILITAGIVYWNTRPQPQPGPGILEIVDIDPTVEPQPQPQPAVPSAPSVQQQVMSEFTGTDSLVLTHLLRSNAADTGVENLVAMRQAATTEMTTEAMSDRDRETAVDAVISQLESLERSASHSLADLITLGNWNVHRRRFASAEQYFRGALSHAPDLPEAWVGLAMVHGESLPDEIAVPLRKDLQNWLRARLDGQIAEAAGFARAIQQRLQPHLQN